MRHGQRERGGHGSVNGVAAGGQYPGTQIGGDVRRRDDESGPRPDAEFGGHGLRQQAGRRERQDDDEGEQQFAHDRIPRQLTPAAAGGARRALLLPCARHKEVPVSKINVSKVLMGGIAAGAVLAACDFAINNFILNEAWQRVMQARNVDLSASGGSGEVVKFILIDLAIGLLIVWVYAAIRPRLGPGPGTAMKATLVVFAAGALNLATFAPWMFSWDMFLRSAALGAIAMLVAGWVGGWVYSEETDQE